MNGLIVTYGGRTSDPFPVLQYYFPDINQVGIYPAHNLVSNGEYTADDKLVAIWRVKSKNN